MKWIRFLCSIKWLLVKSRNNINYYWLKKCHSDCNKINILLSAGTLWFPNTNHAHMVSIKEFSFVSTQLNILIHCMSNLRVHRPWSLMGQIQYVVFIGKINEYAKVVYHYTGKKIWWAPQLMKKWHLLNVQKWRCSVLIPAYIQSIIAIISTFTGSSLLL